MLDADEAQPRPDRVLVLGRTVVEIWDGACVRTTLPDGKQIIAAPEDTDDYRATARRHGYGDDTFTLCVHHEIGHSLLAALLGLPECPVMRHVAEGRQEASHLIGWNEAAVLAIQAFCQEAGVDLLAVAARVGSQARRP